MPQGASALVVAVYDQDALSRDDLLGRGQIDLRAERKTVHTVNLYNDAGRYQGSVRLFITTRSGPRLPLKWDSQVQPPSRPPLFVGAMGAGSCNFEQ